jgi:hypothetical protein
LTSDAEVREEEYMAGGSYSECLIVIKVRKHKTKQSELHFRALLLTEDDAWVLFHLKAV